MLNVYYEITVHEYNGFIATLAYSHDEEEAHGIVATWKLTGPTSGVIHHIDIMKVNYNQKEKQLISSESF